MNGKNGSKDVVRKNKNSGRKKCDICGRSGRLKTRRNFPFGKKSKARTLITCSSCEKGK